MEQVMVLLKHYGDGEGAVPIAVLKLDGTSTDQWRARQWFLDHGWMDSATHDNDRTFWTEERGLYGSRSAYGVYTDPMILVVDYR